MKNKYITDLIEIFQYYNRKKYKNKLSYNDAFAKLQLINSIIHDVFENKDILKLLSIFTQATFKEEFFKYLKEERYEEFSEEYEHIFNIINLYSLPVSEKLNLKLSDDNINSILNSRVIREIFNYLKFLQGELNEIYLGYTILNNKLPSIIEYLKKCEKNSPSPISKEILEKIDLVFEYLDFEVSLDDKREVQMLIMKYNSIAFESIFRVKESSSTTLTEKKLENLFLDFGYDFSSIRKYKEQILEHCDYSELEKILAFFREKGIQIDSNTINIVIYSTYNNIINVFSAVDKSKQALLEIMCKTPSAFISISNEKKDESILNKVGRKKQLGSHEHFIQNIKLLSDIGFNFNDYYCDYPTVYTMNSKKLNRNIADLEKYGFDLKTINKSSFKLSCLKSSSILDTIDQAIELECLNYFLNNTSRLILGPSDLIFYRLYYIKHYNEEHKDNPIAIYSSKNPGRVTLRSIITDSTNNKLNVTNSNKVTVTETIKPNITSIDEDIAKFIQKHDTYIEEEVINDPLIRKLDATLLDPDKNYVYNFGGKCISRFKVLRIYGAIKGQFPINHKALLLYAICYNSIINEEEFIFIKNTVNEIKEIKEGMIL